MSFFGGAKNSASQQPVYTGLQIQTSINTLPIPPGWGRFRVSPNILWYANFQKHASSQSGGKGGGGSSAQTTYTYSADIIMGICEGPISSIGQVWKDDTVYDGIAPLGLSLAYGNTPQTGWSYLYDNYPSQALAYPGTAYVCAANYDLGSGATLPNHNYEVLTPLAGTGANGVDADPAQIWDEFLTSVQYGVRFPASSINTATLYSSGAASTTGDAALQTYCRAQGIALSPCITSVETAQSVAQRLAQLCNCAMVWSGGLWNFIPYGDSPITANGVTYLPNMTSVFNFDDDDYQGDGSDDPLQCQVTDITEAYNVERLTIYDRANAYSATPVEARDESAVNLYGLRIDTSISAYEICDTNVAAIVAQLILQRGLYIRNTYTFKLDWRYCGLDPMDIVTLTDANMGMNQVAVRITQIVEDDSGILTVTAEELPIGVATATLYPKQANSNGVDNSYTIASPVNPPVIFEPNANLTSAEPEIWIAASGSIGGVADPNWGGAQVWISTDNATYSYEGTITAPARQGVLLTDLPTFSGGNPDTADTLSVDLTMSGGELASASSPANAAAGVTACYVDGEVVGFETATLTGGDQYALTVLYRGLYGTAVGGHAASTQFVRLDDAVLKLPLQSSYIGVTLFVKLASFNLLGTGLQNLADCVAYEFTPVGVVATIAPPGTPSITPSSFTQADGTTILSLQGAWSPSTGPLLGSYQYQWSADGGSTWTNSGNSGLGVTATLSPALAETDYLLRVRSISQNGESISVWSTSASTSSGPLIASPPSPPTGLVATAGSGSASLSWTASASANVRLYQAFYGTSSTFADATAWPNETAGASMVITGLTTGTLYNFWVVATNGAGASTSDGPVTATPT